MCIYAPNTNNNNNGIILPPERKIVNKNIYYLIQKSGFKVYDSNYNLIGISNGYSLRPTYKSSGAIGIKCENNEFWITGDVKYIEGDNYSMK